jgi:DNA primase
MADQVIQDIKDRLNIADIISGYIQIKKAGANFKALCPFHHEKTPSLQISPQKQIWHCFGCGEGGDVFGFVMRYENLEFKDALKLLADKANVQLPQFRPQDQKGQDEKELLYRINDFAARFYHHILLKDQRGAEALQYLKERGLHETAILQWQIGFAPDDFHSLEEALKQKGVDAAQSIKAGVLIKGERGQIYDRFRGRITFPIFDYFGQIVGFTARVLPRLDDGKMGKYVNSPETIVYNKSKILFGFNFAKDAIRKADEAVLVEGQMDCIAAHQAGFTNTVAVSGTALTEQHLAQLKRFTKNLKFCFDADSAGLAAGRRAGELALKSGFRLKTIILKGAKDPDELIRKSPGLWEKAVKEAVWFLDYYINQAESIFPAETVEQKHYLSEQVIPLLGYISDSLEQEHYIKRISEKFQLTEKTIRGQIIGAPKAALAKPLVAVNAASVSLLTQKEVLGGMLYDENYLKMVLEEADVSDFEDEGLAAELRPMLALKDPSRLNRDSTIAKESLFMVESFLEELEGNTLALLRQLQKSFAILRLNAIKKQQASLKSEINKAEKQNDKAQVAVLNDQFAKTAALRVKYEKLM